MTLWLTKSSRSVVILKKKSVLIPFPQDQLAMKYGAQQAGDQSVADQLKPLSDKLDINKIAEIKKKILSNRLV